MDVELQILKHLARDAQPTVSFIDEYCSGYKDLLPEVRSYECFKYLHLGIISPLKRKSLPEIAKITGISSAQSLHHFLARSPWSVIEIRERRLSKTLQALKGKKITVIIDETIELASEMIEELINFGFEIELVLADSLYGESSSFIQTLDKYQLPWVLAIRSNHGVWMPSHQAVRASKWERFERIFSNQTSEIRYVREIIFGKRYSRTYWEITTDPETLPENSTSFVMTNLPGKSNQIKKTLGNLYGLRTWIEYGFRHCKQELGWTDYRLTKFNQIEKWWEIIISAYLMISLNSKVFGDLNQSSFPSDAEPTDFSNHQQWDWTGGWKSTLNNLRLIIQPTILLWLIFPWLDVFPSRHLLLGFHQLIESMNQFQPFYSSG